MEKSLLVLEESQQLNDLLIAVDHFKIAMEKARRGEKKKKRKGPSLKPIGSIKINNGVVIGQLPRQLLLAEVDEHRNFDCINYDACLDEAATKCFASFSCGSCPRF